MPIMEYGRLKIIMDGALDPGSRGLGLALAGVIAMGSHSVSLHPGL